MADQVFAVKTGFSGAGTNLTNIPNAALTNSSVTIGSTSVSLGGTATTLTGLTLTSPTINSPTGITKSDVGLSNVDNTSDANKPISTATQTALDNKLSLAGGTMTGNLTLSGAPSSDLHAATKAYVDAATAGLNVHDSVKAATTANIDLSTALENADTLDGVTLATGNRVLVKNQTTKSENGIYVVQASGAAVRADDYNSVGEVDAGDFIFVESGTVNAKTGWVQVNAITTLGSDNIEFTQFSGAGTYTAGTGLTLSGTEFSLTNSSITINGSAISLGGTVDTYPSLSSSETLSIAGLAVNFDQNLPPGPIPPVFTITYNAGSPPLSQSSLDIAIDEGTYQMPAIDPLNSAAPNSNFMLDLTSSSNGSAIYTLTGQAFFDNISNIISIPASYVSGADYSTGVTVSAGDIDYSVSAAGKYLTNDGIITSWASVDALPSQSGNSGNFLTTDGTNASWTAAPSPSTATTTNFGTLIGSTSVSGSNVSLGYWALQNNTTGSVNTAIGYTALYANTEGGSNTALGYSALGGNTIGSGNIAIGRYTSYLNTDGSSNNAIGEEALKSNISGNYNNALGKEALYAATGSSNVGLGHRAAYSLTTGSNNIVIGSTAEPSSATVSNEITLGNASITSFRIPGLSLTADSSNPIVQLTSTQTLTNKTISGNSNTISIKTNTAAGWTSADPILAVGEIGFETDTLKFKLGNGSAWTAITTYANVVPSDLNSTLGDYLLVADLGTASGPAQLDANQNLLIPNSSIIFEGATDNTFETTLTVVDPTVDRTITLPNVDGTVITTGNTSDAFPSQTGNSGKYLTTDGTNTSWGTVSGYSAPTIGSTSIGSGATVTTIAGLTLSGATLSGSLTAGGNSGTNGQFLQSTGTGVQWAAAGASVTTSTINTNVATTVDTVAISSFTTMEYTLSIVQGTKVRSSKILVHENGSTVDFTEYGIISTGGTINGIQVSASLSSTNSILQITITDAATTNATVKFTKVVI